MADDATVPTVEEGVLERCDFRGPLAEGDAPPDVLIEVPHGATSEDHFTALRKQLTGPFPDRLERFFFVNTDVGAPECAVRVAQALTDPSDPLHPQASVERTDRLVIRVLRCLVPRTFIDCNRVVESDAARFRNEKVTAAVPDYVQNSDDLAILGDLYARYREAAEEAYADVCGAGGTALILHTYAPRSVGIHWVDGDIVTALERAYEPETYATWPERPEIDLITETDDGSRLPPENLVSALRAGFADVGVRATENETYRLHATTMGHVHATRYPGQVLCMEVRRDLLADPFVPFVPVSIGRHGVDRIAGPVAAALAARGTPRAT